MAKSPTSQDALLFKLLYADSEEEVDALIAADKEMRDGNNWYPLDGRETNYNVINNQSTNGAKAATELMTNMVDAVLTKECLKRGTDPKSEQAPKTMYEAVDRFIFHLNGGKIKNADAKQLKKFAEKNLIIGISGGKKTKEPTPCFTFCDSGEGQHPQDFTETFLSLKAKNKSQIPFVQGKYNMGSSGVLRFCGDKCYKLILSRRYRENGNWGWTLMRKKEVKQGMDYVEYFAPDKNIKEIGGTNPIMPFKTNNDKVYEGFKLKSGTIVKLYEYYLGQNYTGFREAREAFNENLIETILPFRILDFRWKSDKKRGGARALGIDARPFNGMEYLLLRGYAEEQVDESDIEGERESIHIDTIKDPTLGEIHISAVVLKKSKERTGWYQKSNNRIFHHVNGQVLYKESRGRLTLYKFAALKDRVVIFVDASRLNDSTHQKLWKGDREQIHDTKTGIYYKDIVKDALKRSSKLKELHYKISNEVLDTVATDNSRLLVKELLKNDDNFKLLLDSNVPDIQVGEITTPSSEERRKDLKDNPEYIKLKRSKDKEIDVAINKGRSIVFETDAKDEFLQRSDNRGELYFSEDMIFEKFRENYRLENGRLVLHMNPQQEKLKIKEQYRFRVCLCSNAMHKPVCSEEICITITPPVRVNRPPSPPPEPRQKVGLPPYRLLTKDGRVETGEKTFKWKEFEHYQCSQEDGGYVHDLGEQGKIHYINYDNVFFQNYLRKHAKDEKSAAEKIYILGMRILMLGMEYGIDSGKKRNENFLSESVDEVRRALAQGAAATVLTLCDQLPKSFDFSRDKDEEDDNEKN